MKRALKSFFLIPLILTSLARSVSAEQIPINRELMREYEKFLDAEYYQSITEADRATALEILRHYNERGSSKSNPRIILSSGAMTAGKSTVFAQLSAQQILDRDQIVVIDPDEIKAQIPGYTEQAQKSDRSVATRYHILSMYIGDILLEWLLAQSKSAVYMTSLRHLPSAEKLVSHIRKLFSHYRVGLIHVKAPHSTMLDRNVLRFERTGRLVPPPLLLESLEQVENSVWHMEDQVDDIFVFANDQVPDDQIPTPRLVYQKSQGRSRSLNIPLTPSQASALSAQMNTLFDQKSASTARTPQPFELGEVLDIVLDIDWTMTYLIQPGQSSKFVSLGRERYRPSDGLKEMVEVLTKIPGLRLSVASGGLRERNEELLRKIELIDGSNLFERIYRLLSYEQLCKVSSNPTAPFVDCHKKDLQKLAADMRLERTVLIDDQYPIVLEGEQRRSVLWLQRTLNFVDDMHASDAASLSKLRYPPKDAWQWALERYKLAWATGIILEALDRRTTEGIAFREAVYRLTHDQEGALLNRYHPSQMRFYVRGAAAFLEVNPHWTDVPLPLDCSAWMQALAEPQTITP